METILVIALIIMTVIATAGWISAFIFRGAWKQINANLKFLETLGNMAMAMGAEAELTQEDEEKGDPGIHLDDILNDPRLN
jgi:hypothetical protein